MKCIFSENQIKKIIKSYIKNKEPLTELKLSGVVSDFLNDISDFDDLDGMAKSMGFYNYSDMVNFLNENGYDDFSVIRKEAFNYIENHRKNN